ncbi:MAG TPA: DUF5103 domain-containing protein [Tenuifilaceae bacterium]|nr:DUF5103 domain-containing protein [Tenuifilaceae bacterium]
MNPFFRKIATVQSVYLLIAFLYCYSTNNSLYAQNVQGNEEKTFEFVSSPDIKSVKIGRFGVNLSEPAIELGGMEKIAFSFDDLSENANSYSYTITHCNSSWEPSDLFLVDYLDGFEVNEIKEMQYSTGTVVPYVHYRLEIPNNDVRLKLSGNYLLRVFSTYEPEKVLIQKRFVIYESLVAIKASVHQPFAGEERYSSQQVDLRINTQTLRISNHNTEVKTVICQNYPFQGCLHNIAPTHFHDNEIEYTHPDALIFEGGNEFRMFDAKNIRYLSQGLQSIDYSGGEFHVQLKPDQVRRQEKYSRYYDFNGGYSINVENVQEPEIEADYVWVYFTLNVPREMDEGKSVYLFGELTGWQLSPNNKLTYSYERNAYEIRLRLKQGAYSYRYLLADDKTGQVDTEYFEGNHFDTENQYYILTYYQPMGARFERCVGFQVISSEER